MLCLTELLYTHHPHPLLPHPLNKAKEIILKRTELAILEQNEINLITRQV